jgi:hypothetical protein
MPALRQTGKSDWKVGATIVEKTNLRFSLTAFECRYERPSSSLPYHNLHALLVCIVPGQAFSQPLFEMAQGALN